MCDLGRLNYKFINDPNRLTTPLIGGQPAEWPAAIAHVAQRLTAIRAAGGQIAGVGSARATTEELFLFAKLFQGLENCLLDSVPRFSTPDKLLLNADRNPNTRGAHLTGVAANPSGHRLAAIADGIASGAIKALLVLGEDVTLAGIGPDLLAKLELLVAIDILPSATTQAAHVVLPGASFAEKGGTFINAKGRMQQISPAITAPGAARTDWQILSELLAEASKAWNPPAGGFPSLGKVFDAMTAEIPALAGLTLESVGAQGAQIKE
jgi:NADH-quinone oxidoreductase subunit G